jgi:hypothetical protein
MNDTKDTIFTPLLIAKLSCALVKGPSENMKTRKMGEGGGIGVTSTSAVRFTMPFHFNEIFCKLKKTLLLFFYVLSR